MAAYALYALLLYVGYYCTPKIINQFLLFTFLYVDYSLRTLFNPIEFPPATKSQYVYNFPAEVFYSLGQYYSLPLKYVSLDISGKPNSDTAILLVHGFTRNQGDWLWLRKQLNNTGAGIFTVNLSPTLGGIDEIARESLIPKVAEIKKQTGCKNIILVGASMGGVVASYYKEYLDADKDIKAVISIGSPFHGTRVAVAAPGINSRQMCPNSEFLNDLRARMRRNPQDYYQVCSKFDQIIYPWDSALLPETPRTQQLILDFSGHLNMLLDYAVAAQLNTWVEQIQKEEPKQTAFIMPPLLFRAKGKLAKVEEKEEEVAWPPYRSSYVYRK